MAKILKHPRIVLLGLLLIPCWVVALRFFVDLKVIHFVVNLPLDRVSEAYSGAGEGGGRFFYGPASLVMLLPFAGLSQSALQVVWALMQTAGFVLFWMGMKRLFPYLWQERRFAAWFFVWVMAINPIHNNFQSNNIQLMLMAVLIWAEIYSRSSGVMKPFLAGLLTTAAASVKIFPAFIVLFYFVARGRATKLGQVFGILLFGLLPFLVFGEMAGWELYRAMFKNLTTYHADNSLTKVPDILCLPSLIARTASTSVSPMQLRLVTWGLFLFGVLAFLGVAKRFPKERLTWALGLTLMTLFNPSSRVHYFIFLVPAVAAVLEMAALPERVLMVLAIALVGLTTEFVVGKPLNDALEFGNLPTWGMLVLVMALAVALLRSPYLVHREAT